MNSVQQRSVPWLLTLALLCLSAAVFIWVLQYKMSLYHAEHSAPAPAAKLWMGHTDHAGQEIKPPHLEQFPVLIPALFLISCFSLFVFFCTESASSILLHWRQLDPVWKFQLPSFLDSLYLRPPPLRF